MYSEEEKTVALKLYQQVKSVTKVIRLLDYPTRRTMYDWLNGNNKPPKEKKYSCGTNFPTHPRNPSLKVKLNAIYRCFELGEDVKLVSEEIGYSRTSIYIWCKKYIREGRVSLMNNKNKPRVKLEEGNNKKTSREMEELISKINEMQMEIDILKETINVIKKDPGIDQSTLKNKEKAVIVDALKSKYSLPILQEKLNLSKSSYYYQKKVINAPDKKESLRIRIKNLFEENQKRYGYRRIHALLTREGIRISEKIIRKLMKEENLTVFNRKYKKYNSYKGEITPAAENMILRNFHAEKPNEKWLTDISEFAIPSGKIYLSVLVDCFDGMLLSWKIGIHPDSKLVNSMLDNALDHLKSQEHPIVHTDQGCHYRWPGWISKMKSAGLKRSMSKKGCSPDNAACEGVFGRIKNEMFYNQKWLGVSVHEFINILNLYLKWYNEKRIKISLGNMSPLEYRQNLGLNV